MRKSIDIYHHIYQLEKTYMIISKDIINITDGNNFSIQCKFSFLKMLKSGFYIPYRSARLKNS